MLAPYNDAMRLGMGFNTFTQSLCIDSAVQYDSVVATNAGVPKVGSGPSQVNLALNVFPDFLKSRVRRCPTLPELLRI